MVVVIMITVKFSLLVTTVSNSPFSDSPSTQFRLPSAIISYAVAFMILITFFVTPFGGFPFKMMTISTLYIIYTSLGSGSTAVVVKVIVVVIGPMVGYGLIVRELFVEKCVGVALGMEVGAID